jgi:transcription factor IIIB subunit 2
MVLICPGCKSADIDFQEQSGHSACVSCGIVVEENTIVSSIEFQESGERSHVVGQYVSASCSKPYSSVTRGRGRYGNSRESRDSTLAQARRIIAQVASGLRLPALYVDRAYRLYQLALDKNFVFGRRQMHVVATCLYTICRQEKSPHLLIDFSDALQVNVFTLGGAFLRFTRMLNINIPPVDPALYIHRFAARLDLGDKTNAVVTTTLRLIAQFKKDWITTGRRPDGVCAAAMLIATRAHGFSVKQTDMYKLFRISADTLKKRLDDFKATPSSQLTLEQFQTFQSDIEFDPPSYLHNLSQEEADRIEIVGQEGDQNELRFSQTIGDVEVSVPIFKHRKATSIAVTRRNQEKDNAYDQIGEDLSVDEEDGIKLINYVDDIGAATGVPRVQLDEEVIEDGDFNDLITDENVDVYLLPDEERQKRSDIWELTYRPFMDEREKRKQEKAQDARVATTNNNNNNNETGERSAKKSRNVKITDEEDEEVVEVAVKRTSSKINYKALDSDDEG